MSVYNGLFYWIIGLINLVAGVFAAIRGEYDAATYFTLMAFMLFYFGDKRLDT